MKRQMKIKIRKFNISYKLDLLKIFNSGRKTGFFGSKEKVKLKDHNIFLKEKVLTKKTTVYLGFIDNNIKPFGFVRFDKLPKKDWFEMPVAIYPRFYNLGLGTKLINLAIKRFNKAGKKTIIAVVKKNNHRSLKAFIKNKFKLLKTKKRKYYSINKFNIKKEYYLYLKSNN